MQTATTVLFLLPAALLCLAWKRQIEDPGKSGVPHWRLFSSKLALALSVCATILALVFFYSWFHNGGSPHGLTPPVGVWKNVARPAFFAFLISVAIAALGKGRWRLFFMFWALSMPFVSYLLFVLEMD